MSQIHQLFHFLRFSSNAVSYMLLNWTNRFFMEWLNNVSVHFLIKAQNMVHKSWCARQKVESTRAQKPEPGRRSYGDSSLQVQLTIFCQAHSSVRALLTIFCWTHNEIHFEQIFLLVHCWFAYMPKDLELILNTVFNQQKRRIYLHSLYQRIMAGRVVLDPKEPILSSFTWEELSIAVQDQVVGLMAGLNRANERVSLFND